MKVNLQQPEKQEQDSGNLSIHSLSIHSMFKTIQGEGPSAGTPAVFIRLAGCNLQCPGCDTDYTSTRKTFSLEELLKAVETTKGESKIPLIVFTGGEPFRQNFVPLARRLVYLGYKVEIETNGTLWITELYPSRFSVICSPKTPILSPYIKRYISAVKYIVRAGEIDPKDGLPLSVLDNGLRPYRPWEDVRGWEPPVFVQPMDETVGDDPASWNRTDNNVDAAIASCLKFGYRLSLQTHKEVGLP